MGRLHAFSSAWQVRYGCSASHYAGRPCTYRTDLPAIISDLLHKGMGARGEGSCSLKRHMCCACLSVQICIRHRAPERQVLGRSAWISVLPLSSRGMLFGRIGIDRNHPFCQAAIIRPQQSELHPDSQLVFHSCSRHRHQSNLRWRTLGHRCNRRFYHCRGRDCLFSEVF